SNNEKWKEVVLNITGRDIAPVTYFEHIIAEYPGKFKQAKIDAKLRVDWSSISTEQKLEIIRGLAELNNGDLTIDDFHVNRDNKDWINLIERVIGLKTSPVSFIGSISVSDDETFTRLL